MNKRIIAFIIAAAFSGGSMAFANPAWGAGAADKASGFTIESMMRYALQDEYLARSEYVQIQKTFGPQRPFSSIQRAEENHIAWLLDAYKAYGIAVPRDESAQYAQVPQSLREAYQAGVDAEIANIAMYDKFLGDPLLAKPENASLRDLFTRLRDASKNHLQAFQRNLARF